MGALFEVHTKLRIVWNAHSIPYMTPSHIKFVASLPMWYSLGDEPRVPADKSACQPSFFRKSQELHQQYSPDGWSCG